MPERCGSPPFRLGEFSLSRLGWAAHPRGVVAAHLRSVPANDAEASTARPDAQLDADLVVRARGGDAAAEEALYRRHVQSLTRLATRVLGKADAEDVVQDAFVTALTRLPSLRDGAAFGGWLRRIALNLVRAKLRRRAFFVWRTHDEREGEGLLALAAPGLGPDDLAELARFDRALARLPAEARLAWTLRHVEGWSLEEVADGLGVSLATAKRRLAVADEEVARHARGGRTP